MEAIVAMVETFWPFAVIVITVYLSSLIRPCDLRALDARDSIEEFLETI